MLRIKFSGGRQFSSPKSPTSCSCNSLAVMVRKIKTKIKMKITVEGKIIEFLTLSVDIKNRNQENIFKDNTKRNLNYILEKAINKTKDRLHGKANELKQKYRTELKIEHGKFLLNLKNLANLDYKIFLNKYGDGKFCEYSITKFQENKGIYCYIVDNKIVYIGRSKKTFGERFKEYGKITPYKCLIDGQATNCNINSKVNELKKLMVGFHIMNNSSDKKIEKFEKVIIHNLKQTHQLWNVQKN